MLDDDREGGPIFLSRGGPVLVSGEATGALQLKLWMDGNPWMGGAEVGGTELRCAGLASCVLTVAELGAGADELPQPAQVPSVFMVRTPAQAKNTRIDKPLSPAMQESLRALGYVESTNPMFNSLRPASPAPAPFAACPTPSSEADRPKTESTESAATG